MKIKRLPEDFEVEELTEVRPAGGPFALYRLTKRSIGTFEAIDAVARRWRLPRAALSYGGLKDRHAVTRQYVTVINARPRPFRDDHLQLEYLGQTAAAFTPKDITGNRFRIVVRDLAANDAEQLRSALDEVRQFGIPNYFDDQRFGSLGESGEFIAEPWCAGNFERALWLALADPNEDDRPTDRDERRRLREHWGDWKQCLAAVRSPERRGSLATLAQNPHDFRRAFVRLPVDLRGLYLAAFQSALWNEILAEALRRTVAAERLCPVALKTGTVPFLLRLEPHEAESLAALELPLPSARLHLDDSPLADLYHAVLARRGYELRQLRVKYPRDSFFAKGERAAVVIPANLAAEQSDDDLEPGRQKATLAFDLPRGSYATILIKRVTACESL